MSKSPKRTKPAGRYVTVPVTKSQEKPRTITVYCELVTEPKSKPIHVVVETAG